MSEILYFDCSSGISGDMILGACVDAGVPFKFLAAEIKKLKLHGYKMHYSKVLKAGISASKVSVQVEHHHHHAHSKYTEIDIFIKKAGIDSRLKEKAREIFLNIARAESKIHGESLKNIHFHELGNIDTIIDVVGALVCFKELGINNYYSSPVNLGGNAAIKTSHGLLSNPAPATAEIIKGAPVLVYFSGIPYEIVTPTGAAILSGVLDKKNINGCNKGEFYPAGMNIKAIGYGAGDRDIPGKANVLRVITGTVQENSRKEDVVVLETNIDDTLPLAYETLMHKLFAAGALDVFLTQIQMKKNRPAVKLEVICENKILEKISAVIFSETTTFGLRVHPVSRLKLEKELSTVSTKWGKIRVKTGRSCGKIMSVSPEYEDCRNISIKKNIPLKIVIETAKNAFNQ